MQCRLLSALSVIRRGCRSPRRLMATATDISAPAIRMGMRIRIPMGSRRAMCCGGLERDWYFKDLWRGKFLVSNAEHKLARCDRERSHRAFSFGKRRNLVSYGMWGCVARFGWY